MSKFTGMVKLLEPHFCTFNAPDDFDCQKIHSGLSLKGRGGGFPPATKNVSPSYFRRKIEEK